EVDEEDIARIVSRWAGSPGQKMLEGEVQKLSKMEERLHDRVVGQDEAVTAVANAVRRGRAGLSDPNRPIGSFIFLGPTGVGKTELARALATFLFDDEPAMVRIDMSEYMEKNTVVIMTSNLGTAVLQDPSLPEAERRRLVMDAVRAHFRPEFLNRVDDIIIFKPLSREQIYRIVQIQLEALRKRLAERRITLALTPAALEMIANEGYDPTYGARPLKRVIQRRLHDPLALAILNRAVIEDDTPEVDAEG